MDEPARLPDWLAAEVASWPQDAWGAHQTRLLLRDGRYYGDELGLGDVAVAPGAARDPAGRDPQRAPMPWSLVAEQREDPGSPLSLTRELIARRRGSEDLRTGDYETLPAPAGVWAWRRGAETTAAVNLTDEQRTLGDLVLGPWEAALSS